MEKIKPQNKKERESLMKDLMSSDEILERDVVGIGTGAHINIPKKHLGKTARVFIMGGYTPCEKCGNPAYYKPLCNSCEKKEKLHSADKHKYGSFK